MHLSSACIFVGLTYLTQQQMALVLFLGSALTQVLHRGFHRERRLMLCFMQNGIIFTSGLRSIIEYWTWFDTICISESTMICIRSVSKFVIPICLIIPSSRRSDKYLRASM